MVDSVRASKQGLEIVDQKRRDRGWHKDASIWLGDGGISRATLQRFWRREPIREENFIAICRAIGIDNWRQIVDTSPTQVSYIDFSVYNNEEWAGRETLINQLSNKIRGSCRVLLLVGITGIGKTALAERLVDELRGDWTEIRENFEKRLKDSDFVSVALEWLRKLGETVPKDQFTPEKLLRRLVKRLCENRHLILMDSLESLLTGNEEDGWGDFADEWWDKFFVHLLSESSCQSRLILTSQDLPTKFETAECDRYRNLWYCQLLRGLETSEQIELFQKAGLDVDLELPHSPLHMIGEVYDGHPLALRIIAGEIKKSYGGSVRHYWKGNSRYIEEVKQDLDAARNQGIVQGDNDRWQLASYTKELRKKVNERIEKTFQRLKSEVYDAYLLLCAASKYREYVPDTWWLSHLECRGYNNEQQNAAIQTLHNRYLVEDGGINHKDELMVGQHNLIRSVAIAHRLQIFPEN